MHEQPKVLLAHPGTQYSHRLAEQLARFDSLFEFWTGFALTDASLRDRLLQQWLPARWSRKMANRVLTGVSVKTLRTLPLIEWRALRQLRHGEPAQRVFQQRNQIFQEQIPISSLKKASVVIGFDTSSWLLAQRTRLLNKPFFLDQSISHPINNERILQKVALKFPDWAGELHSRLPDVLASETQEYRLAHKIVVASSYTKHSLADNGVDADKIVVNPYGVNLKLFRPPSVPRTDSIFRFLFLGSISARKGVPVLLEAWKTLSFREAELWLIGPVTENSRSLIPSLPNLKVWGSRPHRELPELLRRCDVLVFPSYCEGFGLVLLEALASGLPIITTDATAGPDLIQDGREGYLIPSGNLEALCEAMKRLVRHRDELRQMSLAARRVAQNFAWENYGDRWQQILKDSA